MDISRLSVAEPVQPDPVQILAQVMGPTDGGWMVESSDCRFACRISASCLLQPIEGDQVLVVCAGDQAWILAVLERESGHDADLQVQGNLNLKASGGRLGLFGETDVLVHAGSGLRLKARTFSLAASVADMVCTQTRWIAGKMKLQFGTLGLFGTSLDSVTERYTQSSKTALRKIGQMDKLDAGMVDYRAESLMNLRGRNVVAQARELAKINADQVHLG